MIIVREVDLPAANTIFAKYGVKPVYSVLPYNGKRYIVFENSVTAALLEVDMVMGCQYKEGKIIEHDQV